MPAPNKHLGEIAAVCTQKRQCELGSYYPARSFVKPLPRQYATTLGASEEAQCDWEAKKDRALLTTVMKPEKNE